MTKKGINEKFLDEMNAEVAEKKRRLIVAIQSGGIVSTHLPGATGGYMTLCGLAGDDQHPAVDQRVIETPRSAKVTCSKCYDIFAVAMQFRPGDFADRG